MEPSSSNTGFFQPLPELQNQFHDDVSIQRILALFVPPEVRQKVEAELAQLGADVLAPRIFEYISDAERNLPYLRGGGRNAVGQPTSELVTGEGWRSLQAIGIEKGFVAYNYTTDYGPYSRLLQMMRFHLWEASAASTTCPCAMTDGAARLLQRQLALADKDAQHLDPVQRRVFENAYSRLTSRDPSRAWTSGQWMTERPGGSDVSQTETVATRVRNFDAGNSEDVDANGLPLGPWSVDGFKWFSSATDAGMTVLLARTHPSKGLSAFYAPMRRRRPRSYASTKMLVGVSGDDTELNGVRIQRLKDKSGTRPVPTAELELKGMRAWMIGREGQGVREIATVLAITRVHCSINCLGLAGRALGVAKSYSLVREISGGANGGGSGRHNRVLLCRSPLHMQTLADLTGEYHGMMLLTMFTAFIMGVEERMETKAAAAPRPQVSAGRLLQPPPHLVAPLLRALSSLHKAYCCKQSVPLLHAACMEALGGIGYLLNHETEPLNMARLFRDGSVNAIWEGTTDVLSNDLVRTLAHRPKTGGGVSSLDALEWLVLTCTAKSTVVPEAASTLGQRWNSLRARIEPGTQDKKALDDLLAGAHDILFEASEILIGCLMLADAQSDGASSAAAMCQRFLVKKGFSGRGKASQYVSADESLATNTAIVYGDTGPSAQHLAANAKL